MKIDDVIWANRNEWIVYAKEVLMMDVEDIAEKVNLAVSTIKSYVRKFSSLLERAYGIFDKIYFPPKRRNLDEMIDTNNIDLLDSASEKCYLFRFYDKRGKLVCSKVGTTKRTVKQRLKEELRSKTYSDCAMAIIDRVYDCGNYPAEGLESRIRAEYIKKYPNSFCKNDRFIKKLFDLEEVDKIVKDYFK